MPILFFLVKRNAKIMDDQLIIVSDDIKAQQGNQERIIAALTDVKLSLKDVENRANQNNAKISEFKGETMTHFAIMEKRIDRHGEIVLKNKEDIAIMKNNFENCPARKKI